MFRSERFRTTRRTFLLAGAAAGLSPARSGWSIHPEHPRLFFRRRSWGPHRLTLDEVGRRGAAFADSLRLDRKPDPEAAPDLALLYVITGEEEAARKAVGHMKRGFEPEPWTTTAGDQIEAVAIAYDWLRGTWHGFPQKDRMAVEEILIGGARQAMRNLEGEPSIYHTRMYAWANAVLFTGLALHGEREEAARFIDYGIRYWKERLIPARAHLGGAWFNAMSYGQKYMCRSVFSMLSGWRSATGENLWETARRTQGDWARSMAYYLMYMLRPDHTFAGYGDLFDSMANSCQGTMRLMLQAAYELRDPHIQGFLKEIRQHCGGRSTRWESRWYQVFYDPSIPSRPRSELPRARLFGRDSIGMLAARSGWGPDDVWLLFKCGDYGDNHGHFDQGHFEIFYKSPLAVDHHYGAKTTKYHNTILVSDPSDPRDEGEQRKFSRQVHGTLESYLADPVVETGSILDYRAGDDLVYVCGDATAAYDTAKVKAFTRQLVFAGGKHIVIFDTVRVARPGLRCRWQIHCSGEPEIEGALTRWVNGGAQLITQTLLPRAAEIRYIPCSARVHPGLRARWARHWPAGRIEVRPASSGPRTVYFLHVLTPGDPGEKPPAARLEERGNGFELKVAGRRFWFGKDGRTFRAGAPAGRA